MDVSEISHSFQAKLSSSKKANRDNGFKGVFHRKISEIDAATHQPILESKADVLKCSHKILSLLDDYVRELKNPSRPLKDIEPLVKSIEEETGMIEAWAAHEVHDDHELERLIKDLTVTANVAVYKFKRGDHI